MPFWEDVCGRYEQRAARSPLQAACGAGRPERSKAAAAGSWTVALFSAGRPGVRLDFIQRRIFLPAPVPGQAAWIRCRPQRPGRTARVWPACRRSVRPAQEAQQDPVHRRRDHHRPFGRDRWRGRGGAVLRQGPQGPGVRGAHLRRRAQRVAEGAGLQRGLRERAADRQPLRRHGR